MTAWKKRVKVLADSIWEKSSVHLRDPKGSYVIAKTLLRLSPRSLYRLGLAKEPEDSVAGMIEELVRRHKSIRVVRVRKGLFGIGAQGHQAFLGAASTWQRALRKAMTVEPD